MTQPKTNIILTKLEHMSIVDRMLLLKKYMRYTEEKYDLYDESELIDIIIKIHHLKFSKRALLDSILNADPIVDIPGYRFEDFLIRELAC